MIHKSALRGHFFFIPFVSILLALNALSIDAYLPAIPTMAEHFSVEISAVNLTMSFFLVGGAIGQFFGGALSDQMGRKTLGLAGLAAYSIAALLIVFAEDMQQVYGLRLVQAVGSGLCAVISMAQVRDVFAAEELQQRYSNMIMVMLVAALIAPLLGASLLQLGWQAIFIFIGALGAACFLIYWLFIPETMEATRQKPQFKRMLRGYKNVVMHRKNNRITAFKFILFSGFSGGIFMSFLTNSASIFMGYFHLSEYTFALLFGSVSIGLMTGNRLVNRFGKRKPALWVMRFSNAAQIATLSFLVGALYLGFESIELVGLSLLVVLVFFGMSGPSATAALMALFKEDSGSAASLNSTFVFGGGALIGGISTVISQGQPLPVASVMLGSAVLGCITLTQLES
ncbi:MAG: multidrug effflux MFS transporter [Pseudomonadales bacterium]